MTIKRQGIEPRKRAHDLGSSLAVSIVLGAEQLLLFFEFARHDLEAVGEELHAVEAKMGKT